MSPRQHKPWCHILNGLDDCDCEMRSLDVDLPLDLIHSIEREAERHDVTVDEVVRWALENYRDEHGQR